MLVNTVSDTHIDIILETDVALLTGQLAAWWGNASVPPPAPHLPMVLAAREHAAGWRTWEMKPYTDLEGRPIDSQRQASYLGPHWVDLWERGVTELIERDLYAALLVSRQWEMRLQGIRATWPPDLEMVQTEQQELREHLVDVMREEGAYRLETEEPVLAANAQILRFLDQLATYLVRSVHGPGAEQSASSPPAPWTSPVGEAEFQVQVRDQGQVTIEPYPFGTNPLPVSWTVYHVPNRSYANQAAFLADWYRAPRLQLSCSLSPETIR